MGDAGLWYDDRIFRFEEPVSSGEGHRCPQPSAGDDCDLALLYTSGAMGRPIHARAALRLIEAECATVLHGVRRRSIC